jgi:exopolysaccharide biosynthesis polyprenyl glycosylphosphotransferase
VAQLPVGGASRVAPLVVAQRHSARDRRVRRLLVLSDALALLLALALAFLGSSHYWSYMGWSLLLVPFYLVIYNAYRLYSGDVKRISHGAVDDLPGLAHALLLGGLAMWLYLPMVSAGEVDFKHVLWFGILALTISLLFRTALRRAINRWLGAEHVLLVGEDDTIGMLVAKLANHSEYALCPIGVVSATTDGAAQGGGLESLRGLPRLGHVDELDFEGLVSEHRVQRIVISHGVRSDYLLELVRRAQELGVKVSLVPQPFDVMGPSVEVDNLGGVTVFGLYPPVLSRTSRALKRAMDIAGSGLLLILMAPLLGTIALAIKLDSRGPVLFRQKRVGRAGQRFYVLKFRTMINDAEDMVEELLGESRDPDWLLLEHDPRITRVGRLLRRTSIDELPQAWNVLRGEMSLVGPRPLVESEDRRICGWGRGRVDLTPGMTGLWQVLGRTSIPFSEMVTLDYLYVTNWSLWRDVKLLLCTVPVLLSRRGAN